MPGHMQAAHIPALLYRLAFMDSSRPIYSDPAYDLVLGIMKLSEDALLQLTDLATLHEHMRPDRFSCTVYECIWEWREGESLPLISCQRNGSLPVHGFNKHVRHAEQCDTTVVRTVCNGAERTTSVEL